MEMASCIFGIIRSAVSSSCSNSGITTFGLSAEYKSKRLSPPFSFFLLCTDELELLTTFFLRTLIKMISYASCAERLNLRSSFFCKNINFWFAY
jgi:hypothetical protein